MTTIAVLSPGGRRGGRPRVAEPRSTVSTWLTASEHDRLIKQAAARGLSVSAHVRALITAPRRPARK